MNHNEIYFRRFNSSLPHTINIIKLYIMSIYVFSFNKICNLNSKYYVTKYACLSNKHMVKITPAYGSCR